MKTTVHRLPGGAAAVARAVRDDQDLSAVLDNGRSATALREAVGHAVRAISAALAS